MSTKTIGEQEVEVAQAWMDANAEKDITKQEKLKSLADAKSVKFKRTQDGLKVDPLMQYSMDTDTQLPDLDVTDLKTLPAQLAARAEIAKKATAKYGNILITPITIKDSQILGKVYKGLDTDNKIKFLGDLVDPGDGKVITEEQEANAAQVVALLTGSSVAPQAAHIGKKDANAALGLMNGEALMDAPGSQFKNPDKSIKDAIEANFQNLSGSMYAGRPDEYNKAYAIYESSLANVSAKSSNVLLTDEDSAKMAYESAFGKVVNYGAGNVTAPIGMDEDTFAEYMDAQLVNLGLIDYYKIREAYGDGGKKGKFDKSDISLVAADGGKGYNIMIGGKKGRDSNNQLIYLKAE